MFTSSNPAKLSPRYHHRIPVPSGSPSAQKYAGPCPVGRSSVTSLGNTAPHDTAPRISQLSHVHPVNRLARATLTVRRGCPNSRTRAFACRPRD
ncbi:hypothetical protein P171DRAFT_79763 [Karstenula rhodostoma CBS 690.94]|uniref:Uncharacterized protein n=1 Tax=Karstenula rhodostoma CBS 690.94 TaxID=1392251 RepID=A0A9P4U9B3_9PLEO|nr:hypothetical protein P171DRAFT_79763 [Karstenula rhodostoma CBS 690.94]